ncbi:vacuolar iron transporter homolog 2.1-like [Carica papaya]|uniref:vacuolar iron transporter homolog 2.1-like n=1 Tax=Carica papaya TaxID=3649 RepID=UPI000B8CFAE5|nr:vacuolar iron transporter homolog 2.1-like [Carica papaya]
MSIHVNGSAANQPQSPEDTEFDYSQRAQWLRAAVLGANDGLVSVSSLMMGVGSVKDDIKAMLLAGFAGLIAGACSMAIGEFVSVYAQRDIETAQIKREKMLSQPGNDDQEVIERSEVKLPSPGQAAIASALAFSVGGVVPLVAAAFINEHKKRLAVVVVVAGLALMVFGVVGAVLGKTPVMKSSSRVVIGGMMAIGITFGLTKLIGSDGLQI